MPIGTDQFLKDYGADLLSKNLNDNVLFLRELERVVARTDSEGRQMIFPVMYGETEGVGAVPEFGALPNAVEPAGVFAKYNIAYIWGRLTFSQRQLDLMRTSAGAFKDLISLKVKSVVDALRWDVNRQFFMDGTGILAKVNEAVVANPVTVDTPGTTWLRNGMRVDFYGGATKRAGGPFQITDVDDDNSQVTVAGTLTAVQDNDDIYRENTKDVTQIDGLDKMVQESGSYAGVDPAYPYSFWKSYTDETSEALSDDDVLSARLKIFKATGRYPDFLITTPDLEKKYAGIITATRMYDINQKPRLIFPTGYLGVEVAGVPIYVDAY
ncbi:MAG: phage major capsid protein, partial [bacterium]